MKQKKPKSWTESETMKRRGRWVECSRYEYRDRLAEGGRARTKWYPDGTNRYFVWRPAKRRRRGRKA